MAGFLPMTTNIEHREQVGHRLAVTIEALHLEKIEVARFLGISTSKLGNWLAGRNYPDEYLLSRFCDRYGVTADWLYRGRLYGLPAELADSLAKASPASSAA